MLATVSLSSAALAEPNQTARSGRFELVTYNVAGLPEGLSNVHPVANLPAIGALLNKFDVALVQEDFAYPDLLRERLTLPYKSPGFVRGEALHFGDGLSLFSRSPATDAVRVRWQACHGVVDSYFDCLTPKGFASWQIELSPGLSIDVYDVHLDAGATAGDVEARAAQLRQLAAAIEKASQARAVLLGGDFNLTHGELAEFRRLMSSVGLVDVCDELHCPQPWRLDRVLFRSSQRLRLFARAWRIGTGFRDPRGGALSDHEPVIASFGWKTLSDVVKRH
ncbi:MAG TPA: endonuclease/exonuclease/phosphatase family protein [Polyangiaceae bacterium]|nr:endonuclease/exonuclease/phosphatase family protein [Polyangiaceae bacterium]